MSSLETPTGSKSSRNSTLLSPSIKTPSYRSYASTRVGIAPGVYVLVPSLKKEKSVKVVPKGEKIYKTVPDITNFYSFYKLKRKVTIKNDKLLQNKIVLMSKNSGSYGTNIIRTNSKNVFHEYNKCIDSAHIHI